MVELQESIQQETLQETLPEPPVNWNTLKLDQDAEFFLDLVMGGDPPE